ncbi:MAG: hypothetical protein AB7N54_02875 [Alphaproteobacteria bacterium]
MASPLHYASSAAILLLGLGGGVWAAWGAAGPAAALPAAFAAPVGDLHRGVRPMPVFRWQGEGDVARIGKAAPRPDGRIGLSLYPGATGAGADERTVLVEASIRTLWDLRTAPMSDALRARLPSLLSEGERSLEAVFDSPAFAADYAPAYRQVANAAIEAAWRAPDTQLAVREALGSSAEQAVGDLVPVVLPVLLDNAQKALRESFSENPARFLGRLVTGGFDRASLARALDVTLRDPAVSARLDASLRATLSAPETEALAWTFGRALMRETAARQDELIDLTEKLVADPRFAAPLRAFRELAIAGLRDVVGQMLGLGVVEGVHPISAIVIRAFLRLESPHFLLVVPTAMAERLGSGELPAGRVLQPVSALR